MLVPLIQFVQSVLVPLGFWGVFTGSVLEEVIAPIPSAIVQLTAGFLFLHGPFTFGLFLRLIFIVAIPAAVGVVLGSLIFYYVGKLIGPPFVNRFGKYVGLSMTDVEKLQRYFEKGRRNALFVFSFRALPVVPSVAVAFFSGFVRVALPTYIIWSFFGVVVRTAILALIGWWAGNLYTKYIDVVNQFELIFWILIAGAIVIGVFLLLRRARKNKDDILVP